MKWARITRSASGDPRQVPDILAGALEPANGIRVEMEEIYAAYAREYARQGVGAEKPEEFVDPLKRFCRACRIAAKIEDGKIYLVNVRLAAPAAARDPCPTSAPVRQN